MISMKQTYSASHVKAQWAYSELLSPTFGHLYGGVEWLKEQASQGARFEKLTHSDATVLTMMFDGVRGGYFNRYFAGVTSFQLAHWSSIELGAARVIPNFAEECRAAAITFREWIEHNPASDLPTGHPRHELNSATPFVQIDPVTVGRDEDAPILLDGYHRACHFWGIQDAARMLSVYLPALD